MDKKVFSKNIYLMDSTEDDPCIYTSLEDLKDDTDATEDDLIAVYELKGIKKMKIKVELA